MLRSLWYFTPLWFALSLCACHLPRGGPSASSIAKALQNRIIPIDENQAILMNKEVFSAQKRSMQQALNDLSEPFKFESARISYGDDIVVMLMSYSSENPMSLDQDSLLAGFNKRDLGHYIVNQKGMINLPYIGNVSVVGLTAEQARHAIQSRYEGINVVREPYILLQLTNNKRNDITVTGDVGAPKIIPWQAGGIKLATALTLAQSNNSNMMRNNSQKLNTNKITVNIIRNHHTYTLPYDVALKSDINLAPADKLIVESSPEVRTTLLGGGILKNGTYSFPIQPSLIEALAEAGGFNPYNADISKVFVFRKNANSQLKIYQFTFNGGAGLAAASFFPILDRDVIFAPEAGIVPWLRITNIAFQMALPAAVLK